MLTGLWTPKGGSGTTVTACAIARLSDSALIIDTVGDVPAVLGLAETDTPGVRDWMASDSPDSRLDDLVEQVDNQLGLIRAGSSREPVGDRSWIRLAEWAARRFDEVVVDIAAFCVARVSLEHLAGAAARTAAAANRPERSVAELLERVAGDSSDEFSFEITQDGLLITVTLERRRRASWSPLALLGSRTMTTEVTAALEPIRGP